MNRKKTILLSVIIAIIAGGFYGGHEYFKGNPDINNLPTAFHTNVPSLLKEFNADEVNTGTKYLGKVMEVEGSLRTIEKDAQGFYTMVLGDKGDMSSVRCALDKVHGLNSDDEHLSGKVHLKGIFTGYNKDNTGLLGSDVQMARCMLIQELK